MFCGSLKQETAVLCSVYFIATDMASKRLQPTLKKAEGPYGWMTSAAQERKPVSFSVPGHRGDGMTAAIGKTWAWPATPAARDTGSPRVRTCHHARASEFSSHSASLHRPHYEAFLSFGLFSLFPVMSSFSVISIQSNTLLSLPTNVIKCLLLSFFFFM